MGMNAVRFSALVPFLSCMLGHSISALGHFHSLPYDRVEEDIITFKRHALPSSKALDDALGGCDDFRYDLPDVGAILKDKQYSGADDGLAKPYFDIDASYVLSPCADIAPYVDAAKNELNLALLNAEECIRGLRNSPRGIHQPPSIDCKFFYVHRDAYIALRDIVLSVMHVCEYERTLPFMDIKGEYRLLTSENTGKRSIEGDNHEEETPSNRLDSCSQLRDIDGPLVIEGAGSPGEDPPRQPKAGRNSHDDEPPRKKRNLKKPDGSGSGGDDDGDDGDGSDDDGDDDERRKRNKQTLDYYLKNYQFINYRPDTSGYSASQIYVTGFAVAFVACIM